MKWDHSTAVCVISYKRYPRQQHGLIYLLVEVELDLFGVCTLLCPSWSGVRMKHLLWGTHVIRPGTKAWDVAGMGTSPFFLPSSPVSGSRSDSIYSRFLFSRSASRRRTALLLQRFHFEEDLRFTAWCEKPEFIEFPQVSCVKRYCCEEVVFEEWCNPAALWDTHGTGNDLTVKIRSFSQKSWQHEGKCLSTCWRITPLPFT